MVTHSSMQYSGVVSGGFKIPACVILNVFYLLVVCKKPQVSAESVFSTELLPDSTVSTVSTETELKWDGRALLLVRGLHTRIPVYGVLHTCTLHGSWPILSTGTASSLPAYTSHWHLTWSTSWLSSSGRSTSLQLCPSGTNTSYSLGIHTSLASPLDDRLTRSRRSYFPGSPLVL